MREYKLPRHVLAQSQVMRDDPDRYVNGAKVFIKDHSGKSRIYLEMGHKPWPAVDLIIDGERHALDSEELMYWLKLA